MTSAFTAAATAFQRGLTALTQWIQREGVQKAVPRGHIERVVINGQELLAEVKEFSTGSLGWCACRTSDDDRGNNGRQRRLGR